MSATNAVSRILVGVDGSDASRRALEWAAALARPLDAEVIAVHATGMLERLDGDAVDSRFEQEWCAPLDDPPVRNRRLMVDGPPPLVMLRVAEQEAVDLIVVGTRRMGEEAAQILGSTSRHLVEHSRVPVTVLHSR
jgi:nucleotide-binding universal stress UspA family protein